MTRLRTHKLAALDTECALETAQMVSAWSALPTVVTAPVPAALANDGLPPQPNHTLIEVSEGAKRSISLAPAAITRAIPINPVGTGQMMWLQGALTRASRAVLTWSDTHCGQASKTVVHSDAPTE